jgi:hypothetical protein
MEQNPYEAPRSLERHPSHEPFVTSLYRWLGVLSTAVAVLVILAMVLFVVWMAAHSH